MTPGAEDSAACRLKEATMHSMQQPVHATGVLAETCASSNLRNSQADLATAMLVMDT